jgi:prepilin-type N-terminal cleavage/methylation domain-containing protein
MIKKQTGFTLIEIAIVLVIIGLLLGGVLKGQELITSARVRNLISVQDGIKAAFFGFQDRFRALPGDYTLATTNINGATVNGNGNGRVESAGTCGAIAGCVAYETTGLWDQLSHAGFINGTYTAGSATQSDANSPKNPYGIYLQLIYDGTYGITSGGATKHNLKTGGQIPVEIIAEVDRKVDDGSPYTGGFQFSAYVGNAATAPTEGSVTSPACTSGNTTAATWNATNGSTNCGGASVF